jgi:3-oxoacyl-(acyl-carrier-protein) synthase
MQAAQNRGADILAVVLGYGSSFDRSGGEGEGLLRAVTAAMADAGCAIDEIDYISSCANSSRDLDRTETRVIRQVFGEESRKIPVSSIKSMVGESFSASGSLSLASAVGVIRDGIIPPTVNYQVRDPECALDYVVNEPRKKHIRKVLITASDPYGQNSAVILGRYAGER